MNANASRFYYLRGELLPGALVAGGNMTEWISTCLRGARTNARLQMGLPQHDKTMFTGQHGEKEVPVTFNRSKINPDASNSKQRHGIAK